MNRINEKLQQLKNENKKALITYVTCGDGGFETTEAAVLKMAEKGADIIELGVPFSDPIAESPAVHAASERSLKGGTTLKGIIEMVKRIRTKTDVPLIFMMYANPVFRFGTSEFFKTCKEIGIDGVIIPDIPYEEKDEVTEDAEKNDVISISLITPSSHERIEKIAKDANGFIYCVSSSDNENNENFVGEIKKYTNLPCAAGFDIETIEQAKSAAKLCDGIIVNSAIIEILAKGGNCIEEVGNFIESIKNAI